ncbi:MAG: SGNH/GDSL hydrolase family protein [Proteobacteria bacterium]|nr:SGNH/GDSL hydrolase family protein [Pseudomonadota bacterium]MBU1739961.1 SGNH/GDSL hydrolase family protein [Pseudomonadota bacterium]
MTGGSRKNGVTRIFKTAGRWYRTAAVVVLNLIVLAVAIELLVQLGGDISRWLSRPGRNPVSSSSAPVSTGAVTTQAQLVRKYRLEEYMREKRGVGGITVHNFWPYIMWKRRSFSGKAINIDRMGMRRTLYNPTAARALKIFCVGGSTTWGDWAADQDTYPSQLARVIGLSGYGPYRVYNLGQAGYSSTQSLIRLMLELRRGNVPDIVIFLSGINDAVIGTAWPKIPGSIFQVNQIRAKMTRTESWRTIGQALFHNLDTIKLLRRWGLIRGDPFAKHTTNPELSGLLRPGQRELNVSELVRLTVEMYRQNVRQAAALARAYGFKIFFIWQPCLYLKDKPLAPWEKKVVAYNESRPHLAVAFRHVPLVYDAIRKNPPRQAHFYDFSGMFRHHRGLIFADPMHLLAPGNRMLARKIFAKIKPYLKRQVQLAGERDGPAR